ncbi:phenylalanine--tRNA ligase subunit alpha [Buchnera aphidicola (Thelaxes californica)]|uniref:Phenylalanine--tRNA ligase alpha subunit n=1 Tax=Buchnera aphidicola (Thelaxes californica) TaxID=1315998 RepID=A0A4D6YA56_9GAMM|nr:phenylalanine--tRNA ligase subunit alpha [Buchnera aphidicola]QCI26657.1 phenylalanine--tRNA ligase subunit alpha [Buchnera aphidicola (Thelaxes californica)]
MFFDHSFLIKFEKKINKITTWKELDTLRIQYLGKKGYIFHLMQSLKQVSKEKKKQLGLKINFFKNFIKNKIRLKKNKIDVLDVQNELQKSSIDVTLPGRGAYFGSLHPITVAIGDIENFFLNLGFSITSGPEIEDVYHNFDALNIPINHPARNQNDTFWINKKILLRTQTSSVQIRAMERRQPPIRMISYGKVYRNDYDSTHTPMFHQLEGLVIEKNLNFSNLKYLLFNFIQNFFKKKVKTRFRSAYFPFTLPSAEIDIFRKNDDKKSEWLEILGCGMVHPNVLKEMGVKNNLYSAFAFGIGIERIIMLRYGIIDLRSFFQNDLSFLQQFK